VPDDPATFPTASARRQRREQSPRRSNAMGAARIHPMTAFRPRRNLRKPARDVEGLPVALQQVWFDCRRSARTVYTLVVYTEVVLDKLAGFEWDAANVGHILRHAVTPFEVEEVAGRPHAIIPAKSVGGENRWKLFGKTASGRYLVVVFTIRRKRFRAVTAYEMNVTDRRNYASQID
jgi:uncharacterized DUF497 family protein